MARNKNRFDQMAVRTHQEVIPSSRISAISCPFVPIYHSGNSTSSTKKNTLFAKIHVYIYKKKTIFIAYSQKRHKSPHFIRIDQNFIIYFRLLHYLLLPVCQTERVIPLYTLSFIAFSTVHFIVDERRYCAARAAKPRREKQFASANAFIIYRFIIIRQTSFGV